MVDSVIEEQNWLCVISDLLRDFSYEVVCTDRLLTKHKVDRQLARCRAQASMPIVNNSIDVVMFCSDFVHTATTNIHV